MPTKLKLTILGRIAYFIIGLKSVNRCFFRLSESVKIHSPATRVLHFPKISQHPACMDHAILHGAKFQDIWSSLSPSKRLANLYFSK